MRIDVHRRLDTRLRLRSQASIIGNYGLGGAEIDFRANFGRPSGPGQARNLGKWKAPHSSPSSRQSGHYRQVLLFCP